MRAAFRPFAWATAIVLAIALPLQAQITVVWGGGSGSWNTAANWVGGSLPSGKDTAQLSAGTASVDSNVSIAQLLASGGGLSGSATLTLTGPGSTWSSGSFNSNGGTLAIASGASLDIATTADHDLNARAILNSGTINWSSGYLRGGQGASLTNAVGATFNDLNTASYTLHVPSFYGGSFVFTNAGTYTRATTGTTGVDIPFDNTGLVSVSGGGSLSLNAGGTSSGVFTVTGAGSSLVLANSYTLSPGATLNGLVRVTGGTLTVNGNVTVDGLSFEGGGLAGTHTLLGGTLAWTGGTWNASPGDRTTLAAGTTLNISALADHDFNARSLTNNGTVNWSAGYLRAGQGSVLTNSAGATFNDLNAASYSLHVPSIFGGSFTFVNNGLYRRNAGGITYFDIPLTNSGAIDLQQGGLEFRAGGSFTSTGTMHAAAGTTATFNSDFTLTSGSALTGPGTYSLVNGTLTVPTGTLSLSTFNQSGGNLGGAPTINGVYNWTGGNWNAGSALTTTIAAGSTLNISTANDHDFNVRSITNHGTVNWSAGYLRAGQGSVFTNSPGATFNDLNASSYSLHVPSFFGGAYSFVNNGTYRRSATGTTYFDVPFYNNAAVDLQQGALEFRAGGTLASTGTLAAATGTDVFFRNDYTIAHGSALTGLGNYWLTGGLLTVNGTLAVSTFTQTGGGLGGITNAISGLYHWQAGHWNAGVASLTTINPGATLNIATTADHDLNLRSITNTGTVNWTAGYIRGGQGSVFTNSAGATFNDLNAASYSFQVPSIFGGTFNFVNNGTYRRNAAGTTYLDIPFYNNSTIDLVQGSLEFRAGGTMSSTGTIAAAAGTSVFFRTDYTLANSAALTGAGSYALTGGTLTLNGAVNLGTFGQTGGTLAGTHTISGAFTWHGGNWNGTAGDLTTLAPGATLNLGNSADHDFNARSITNQGTVNWASGYLRAGQGSVFTNAAGGTFNDLNVSGYTLHVPSFFGGAFTFVNAGTYVRSTGGTTYFDIPFTNSGTLSLLAGDLQLRAGGSMTATSTANAATGARLLFVGDYTLLDGAQFTGSGLFNQISATLSINGALKASSFLWSGGNWNAGTNSGLTTTIAPSTILNLTHDNDTTRDFYGRAIVNQGTVNWSSAYLRSGGGGSFTNAAGGTFNDVQTSGYTIHNPSGFGGAFSFTNNGTYDRNAAGTTYLDAPFFNNGLLNLTQGDLQFRAGGTMSATSVVNAAAGTHLYFTNDYRLATGSQFTGAGLIAQVAGTLTVDGTLTAAAFLWSGGNWNAATNSGLTTTLAASTVLNLTHDSDTTRDFYGRAIVNQGTVNWSSAYLRSGGGGTFTNAAGGLFNDLQTSGYTIHNPSGFGGTFSFINRGTYVRNATGTTYFDAPFDNHGTLNLTQGDLQLRAGGTMAATSVVNAAAGTHLYFTTDYRLVTGAQFTGPGLIDQTAGTLSIDGTLTAAAFRWSGGNWNAATNSGLTTVIASGSTLNLTHDHDTTRDFYGRAIVNQGTVNWSSAYLRSGGGGSFTNAATGTFNDLNSSSYTVHNPSGFGGSFTFSNEGSYLKTTDGTTTFEVPFTNTGRILVSAGTLVFNSTFTNAGAGTLVAAGGNFSFAAPLNLGTGALSGSGTLTASSVTAGGQVAPGNSPGQLNLTGDLTLLSTSTLLIELAGPAKGVSYDFLSIGGNAALAGNLSVAFLAGFQASIANTDTFTIVTAANVTGAFTNVANGQRFYTSDGLGSFVANYGSASAFSPGSVVLTAFVPVPEPSTYALLALGLGLIALTLRRRK